MNQTYLHTFCHRFADVTQYIKRYRPLLAVMLASPEPVPLQVMANTEGVDVFQVRERLRRMEFIVTITKEEGAYGPNWDTACLTNPNLRSWFIGQDEWLKPMAGDFEVQPEFQVLAQHLLAIWEETKKTNDEVIELHGYVDRNLWQLLHMAGDVGACDRISLDFSLHLEHRNLELAIAPGEHAVRLSKQQIEGGSASAEQLNRAIKCSLHYGSLKQAIGDLDAAFEIYKECLALSERLLSLEPHNPEGQHFFGVTFSRIGEVRGLQGDHTGAMESFQRWLVIAEDLAMQDPQNLRWQRNLGVAYNCIGGVLESQCELKRAQSMFRRALIIAERLALQDPLNVVWQRDLVVTFTRIGGVLELLGNNRGAKPMYQKALKINKQLVQHAPLDIKSRRDLFVNYKLLGNLLEHMGDLKGSFRLFQKQLLIAKKLVTLDPLDSQWKHELGLSYCRIGAWFESQGEWSDSLEMFQKCLVILKNLASLDPIDSDRQHDLGVVYNRIGTVLEAKGDLSNALSMHQKALSIVDQLSAKDPINLCLMHELCVAYDRVEGVLVTQGDLTNALEMRLKNLSISEHLALQDPLNADWQRDLAFSLYKTGEIYEKLNNLFESVSLWRRELDIHLALFRHGENFSENNLNYCYNRIGTALVAIGELTEAQVVQSEYQRRSESVLAQDPEDLTKQWNLVLVQVNLARTELLLGNQEVAKNLYIKANQAFDYLNSCENK